MRKIRNLKFVLIMILFSVWFASCNSGIDKPLSESKTDTVQLAVKNTANTPVIGSDSVNVEKQDKVPVAIKKENSPKVLIYNFYATNRCASCIAIEAAAKKTLETYFKSEVKNGTVKLFSLCVDDEANAKLAEKYQAFGSAIFVTRVFKGKETTTDFTGDGFKYAKNKEEKFIEILKNKISEYLK